MTSELFNKFLDDIISTIAKSLDVLKKQVSLEEGILRRRLTGGSIQATLEISVESEDKLKSIDNQLESNAWENEIATEIQSIDTELKDVTVEAEAYGIYTSLIILNTLP